MGGLVWSLLARASQVAEIPSLKGMLYREDTSKVPKGAVDLVFDFRRFEL